MDTPADDGGVPVLLIWPTVLDEVETCVDSDIVFGLQPAIKPTQLSNAIIHLMQRI